MNNIEKTWVDALFASLADSRLQPQGFVWDDFPRQVKALYLEKFEGDADQAQSYAQQLLDKRNQHDPRTHYSMGFPISLDGSRVVLLEKQRPIFLKGKWIGMGGHVEPGESYHEAIVRESCEEANLIVPQWTYLGKTERDTAYIAMFAAFVDIDQAQTMTDERIQIFNWEEVAQLDLSDATLEMLDEIKAFAQHAVSLKPKVRFK